MILKQVCSFIDVCACEEAELERERILGERILEMMLKVKEEIRELDFI